LVARAGIGISAVDDNGPPATGSEMVSVQEYRRSDHTILRENSGNRSADVGHAEGQIEKARFLDAAMDSGGLKSYRCGDADLFRFHTTSRVA
jgi:hypothetical protein